MESVREGPKLEITHQSSIHRETISKNSGGQKNVYVVIKNVSFAVELSSNLDLSTCNLDAKLLYDFDKDAEGPLEVSYVKHEPIEYKININYNNPTKASVDMKIKVLTSQHEDMLFRLRFSGIDPETQMTFFTLTNPVKVISKMTQIKKKPDSSSKKRLNSADLIGHSLSRVETQQSQILTNQVQQGTLLSLLQQQFQKQVEVMQLIIPKLFSSDYRQSSEELTEAEKLEKSFHKVLSVYEKLSPEERQEKISQLLSDKEETSKYIDFFDNLESAKKKKKV